MLRIAARLLSPGGDNGTLSILIFHRVLSQIDNLLPDEVDAQRFDRILTWLAKWFRILPLDVALRQLASGTLPARAAAITFDDGYLDNHAVALPILRRHGMTATFFVATDFLDGGMMFNDAVIEAIRATRLQRLDLAALGLDELPVATIEQRRQALQRVIAAVKYWDPAVRDRAIQAIRSATGTGDGGDPMMKSTHLSDLLSAGMGIGAHTCSHPILARLPAPEALREIRNSKTRLENELSTDVPLFAFPNGKPGTDYLPAHVAMVRECGFRAAVSTVAGVARKRGDFFQVPRFTPWDQVSTRFGMRMMINLLHRGGATS